MLGLAVLFAALGAFAPSLTMRKLYKPSTGVSVGLSWFLLYLLGFFALGYGLLFCVILGMIGGMATGIVAEWWNSKDEQITKPVVAKPVEPVDMVPSTPIPMGDGLRRNATRSQLRRHGNRPQTSTTGLSRFKIPFKKGRK